MSERYIRLWTVKYPDGYLSAFDCLALSAYEARKKASKKWKRSWQTLKKQGFQTVRVIFKEVKS